MTAKKIITKFYAPEKSRNWLLHPFARRYLSHIIIIVIAGLTLAANLNANESRREDLNKTSIISNLITTEDLGAIEEEGPITGAGKKISRYLGQTGVASLPQDQTIGEEIEETSPQTVAGNSALVRQILSPMEAGLRQRDKIIIYTVQEGDSISQIAQNFGISNQTIIWENNLSAYSVIRPGDKLVILPVSGIRHKVLKGETLAKIAKKYGIDGEKIIEFNKLASANDLQIGERLVIPGGKKIYAAAYTARGVYKPTGAVPASTGRMLWPTSCRYISQYFGWRHSGLDIACGFGAPILAANSGVVIKAQTGYNSGYGRMIIIDHGNGQQTLYGHLTKLYVAAGQTVSRGQTIGLMGSTGRSTGPHLHFEVRSGGVRRNPLSYIR